MKTKSNATYKSILFLILYLKIGALWGQITYQPLYNTTTFNAKAINLNLPVGSLMGTADVANGSASYIVPIEIPAGTNGASPSLSINYNSQGNRGNLGLGWSLSGLSSISRSLKTIYHDSIVAPVTLSETDRFVIDGMRLIATDGVYGESETIYSKEMTDFSRVVSLGNLGNGPEWFRYESKEGITMEYGNTVDSRFMSEDNSQVLVWSLNKMIWPDGNYIDFVYETIDREHRIKEIKYTGNSLAGFDPYNKIEFIYASSNFTFKTYEANNEINSSHLLERIIIKAEDNSAFKAYIFKYAHDNINEFLVEIIEEGSDGSKLNATIFQYGDPADYILFNGPSASVGASSDIFTGDYDGDGRTDIAVMGKVIDDDYVLYTNFALYWNNPSTGNFQYKLSQGVFGFGSVAAAKDQYNFFGGDYNGDGRDDIVYALAIDGLANLSMDVTKIFTFDANLNTSTPIIIPRPSDTFYKIQYGDRYMVNGDFNGDGISDIILILSQNLFDYKAYIYYGGISTAYTEFVITGGVTYHAINDWGTKNVRVLDFDGDGKSELMITKGTSSEIFTFEAAFACKSLHAAGFPTEYHLMYFGDFNGDRKTDVLTRTSLDNINAPWYVSYGTGLGWVEEPFNWVGGAEPDLDENYVGDIVHIADLNGDNRQDIFKGRTTFNSNYYIYYSTGSNFHYTTASWTYAGDTKIAGAGDFNGDGRSDIMHRSPGATLAYTLLFNTLGENLLLRKVKNGYGHKTEWQYKLMTEPSPTYMRTTVSAHPVNIVQSPLYLVSNFLRENELTTRYEYRNMKLHKSGRGQLGFGKITKYSFSTNLYEDQEFETDATTYIHMPKYVRFRQNSTVLQLKTFTNVLQQLNTGNYEKIMYHRVSNTLDDNMMEGRMITNSHEVDDYGNTTSSTTNINGIETIVTANTFGTYASFIPNRVETSTITTNRLSEPAYSRTTKYEYNAKGQTTGMYTFFGEPQSVYTQYYYNTTGNQDSTRITASGLTPRTSASVYDPKGRYVMSSRNTLGQSSTVSAYDVRWAKALSTTGIDGLTTTYEYDAFGRLTHTHLPQGYTVNTIYAWELVFPQIYSITTQHPGKPDVKTWYDRSNRVLQTRTYGLGGESINTNTTYDTRGNVQTTTAPYKTGETPLVTTQVYDDFNRVISTSNTLQTTQYNYAYSGGNLTTTTTKVIPSTGNQVNSNVTDATGKVISATDYGGTLTYNYYSNGQIKNVVMGSHTLVSYEYDAYARRISATDINTGTISTEYDAYGQLTKETNPLGHATTMIYDDLGRNTQKIGPEGTTVTEYYNIPNIASVNKVKKITSFGGDVEDYVYDGFGRAQSHTHTIDGTAFTTQFTHNIYDQIMSETYTGGFGVVYTRNARGYVTQVKDNSLSHTFYSAPTYNAYLQPTQYTLGSGFQVNKTYHHSIPTSFQTANGYNMTYVWDYASGNLTSRSIHNQSESFVYDNLNRLTNTTHPASTIATMYAPNGNINSKTNAGPDYVYDSSKIHAMRGITTPVYPNNINLAAQNIQYTSFLQPAYITEGDLRLDYVYGNDYQRTRSTLKVNGVEEERIYYMGTHERKTKGSNTYDIYYISGGDDLIAIAVSTNGGSPAYYYTYTDYLGSIQEITTSTGLSTIPGCRQNYDAWGKRRNHNFQYTSLLEPPDWLIRGYTGHEMLWRFRLINMNGRLYDPVLARVVSPDNVVSNPDHTQGYNRYTYANNNPLTYTDPDGNMPLLVAAAVGAGLGLLSNGLNNAYHHRNFFDGAGKAAAFGAIGGLISAGIGNLATAVSRSAIDAATLQMSLHGLSGGVMTLAQGGNPFSGFVSGATSSIIGSFSSHIGAGGSAMLIGGGLSGGVGAAITGGKFWQGVQQGLITTGLNHLAHPIYMAYAPQEIGEFGGGDPVVKVQPKSQPSPFAEFEGVGLSLVGFLSEGSQSILYNKDSWFDLKQFKSYSHKFHGNQYTGLRTSSAKYSSRLNIFGKLLGGYNQVNLSKGYFNKSLSFGTFAAESGVNLYSTFGGIYGAAVGVGWEMGRYITNTSWYQTWKNDVWLPYRSKSWGY